ncbi:MAG: hypothetical protein JNL85_07040 [Rubrivivax sp.]|nr:hypothetical protein [Rubrivivax sp.]
MSSPLPSGHAAGPSRRRRSLLLTALAAAGLAACAGGPGGGGGGGGYDVSIIDSMLPAIGNESKAATLLATNKSVGGRMVQMKFVPGGQSDQMLVVQAGGPADDNRAAPVGDLWQRSTVTGSALGFRVNLSAKVTVSSSEFKPRVLVLERLAESPGPQVKAAYYVVGVGEANEVGGAQVASISWRQEKRARETIGGPLIAVLSEGGKAGSYSLKVENAN